MSREWEASILFETLRRMFANQGFNVVIVPWDSLDHNYAEVFLSDRLVKVEEMDFSSMMPTLMHEYMHVKTFADFAISREERPLLWETFAEIATVAVLESLGWSYEAESISYLQERLGGLLTAQLIRELREEYAEDALQVINEVLEEIWSTIADVKERISGGDLWLERTFSSLSSMKASREGSPTPKVGRSCV